jgi:hypothetical protein
MEEYLDVIPNAIKKSKQVIKNLMDEISSNFLSVNKYDESTIKLNQEIRKNKKNIKILSEKL